MHLNVRTGLDALNQTRTSNPPLLSPVDSCPSSSAFEFRCVLYSIHRMNIVHQTHIVSLPEGDFQMRLKGVKWNHWDMGSEKAVWMTDTKDRYMRPGIANERPQSSFRCSQMGIEISGVASFQPSWLKAPDTPTTPVPSLPSRLDSVNAWNLARSAILKSGACITSLTRRVNSSFDFWLLPVSFHDIKRQIDMFAQGHGGAQSPEGL